MQEIVFNIDANRFDHRIRLKMEGVSAYSEYLDYILKTEPLNDSLINQVKKELEEEKEELREVIKSLLKYQQKCYGKK